MCISLLRDSQFTYELGILDIAGFENFTNPGERNSYEQLLINITNEHMHQFFLKKVLKAELEAYEREGVQCDNLPDTGNTDNTNAIELLTKVSKLFSTCRRIFTHIQQIHVLLSYSFYMGIHSAVTYVI